MRKHRKMQVKVMDFIVFNSYYLNHLKSKSVKDADTFENPYFYHIYQGEAQPTPISEEGFNEIDTVAENKILRFYFTLPHRIARDTLYVQAQVEVTLESGGARRFLLLVYG
eukprot:84017_1